MNSRSTSGLNAMRAVTSCCPTLLAQSAGVVGSVQVWSRPPNTNPLGLGPGTVSHVLDRADAYRCRNQAIAKNFVWHGPVFWQGAPTMQQTTRSAGVGSVRMRPREERAQ